MNVLARAKAQVLNFVASHSSTPAILMNISSGHNYICQVAAASYFDVNGRIIRSIRII